MREKILNKTPLFIPFHSLNLFWIMTTLNLLHSFFCVGKAKYKELIIKSIWMKPQFLKIDKTVCHKCQTKHVVTPRDSREHIRTTHTNEVSFAVLRHTYGSNPKPLHIGCWFLNRDTRSIASLLLHRHFHLEFANKRSTLQVTPIEIVINWSNLTIISRFFLYQLKAKYLKISTLATF